MQRQTTWVFFFRFVTIKICYWLWFFAVFETCIDTNERLHVWGCSEQQVAVLRQSCRVSSAGLSSSQPPVVQKHTTAVPRIRHIFLCYFHINSAAPSCLSFLSRSNLNTSLHFQTRCCGLALSEGAAFFSTFLWEWKGSTDTSSLPAISPFSCLPPLLVSVMVQLRLRIWKWNLEGRAHIKPATQLHSAHRYKHADSLTNTSDTA